MCSIGLTDDYGGHFNKENSLLCSINQSDTIFFICDMVHCPAGSFACHCNKGSASNSNTQQQTLSNVPFFLFLLQNKERRLAEMKKEIEKEEEEEIEKLKKEKEQHIK